MRKNESMDDFIRKDELVRKLDTLEEIYTKVWTGSNVDMKRELDGAKSVLLSLRTSFGLIVKKKV